MRLLPPPKVEWLTVVCLLHWSIILRSMLIQGYAKIKK